ncbi:hypothetical protein [Pseudorhodoferax sp. Leaf267]|uniref:hypothetical protein n=1 Tax=Pseudorhodoferax sp. Leaf267 TaxID=1736316 RepID=UPI0006F88DFF|nr:hypothetical protein [Pseudorhodoferax sp. Leaf267]KQP12287.1 hypothetical protein ASF43_22550 [Pseudorhodoferax sp. Leaf267]
MPLPTLTVELTSPQTVDGRHAAYQSLWLLVRLQHAQRTAGIVRLDDLRGQVSSASTLRMVVSRAFRDFKAWGLQVGWGEDQTRDPRFLNAEGRSQGPFWLPAREAKRLRLRVDGKPASAAEIAAFLGLSSPRRRAPPGPAAAPPDAVHVQDAQFWQQLVAAQQAMRQGRWAVTVQDGGGASALQAMRAAGALAGSDFQRALVTLNEALLWRRLGDDAQARKRVAALQRQRLAQHVAGHEYLGAMAAIVAAWCSYTARDLPLAQAQLEAMARDPAHAPLLRWHPHVRFEWSNLWALACRSRALGLAAADRQAALAHADEAMQHFGRALAAAFESHSFDAAQHVAANMGMAVWLFERVGLPAPADGGDTVRRAVQWIAFSEWLSDQTEAQARSAWNAIYLLRIARGSCRATPGAPLAAFRALVPLARSGLADLAGALAPTFASGAWPARWADVARVRLDEHASGRRRYPGLQLCSLLFEHAWYTAHAGDLRAAAASLAALRALLPQLVASDRAYFREVWNDELPAELLALEPAPRRPARRVG